MALDAIIVIPARYESSRLPGKPLIDLLGVSMIRRTYNQCIQAIPSERVYVATDDQRIVDHCQEANIRTVMTSATCLTGTDRIAEVSQQIEADVYINVQGDEPIIDPEDILQVINAAEHHPNDVINGMTEINDEELFFSPTIPKVVARPDGRLLYMSRAAIPTNKSHTFEGAHRQVCIYAFPKTALDEFAAVGHKTPLEHIEDIEILRFLEMGYEVRMLGLSSSSISVDTEHDVDKVKEAIRDRGMVNVVKK